MQSKRNSFSENSGRGDAMPRWRGLKSIIDLAAAAKNDAILKMKTIKYFPMPMVTTSIISCLATCEVLMPYTGLGMTWANRKKIMIVLVNANCLHEIGW